MSGSDSVVLPIAVARAIRAQARAAVPRECCGFLVGRGRRVQFAVAMPNAAGGTGRYRVDPKAHVDLVRTLRRMRPVLQIVGVYHSHPAGPPRPSATDLAASPDARWVHVIAGPVGRRIPLTIFRFSARGPRKLAMELVSLRRS